jgi:methionyl aminopeptidase
MAKRKSKIQLRSGSELDGIREAGFTAAEVLSLTCGLVRPGITTGEIDRASFEFMSDRSCKSAFLGYKGFPGHICISINEEVVHGIGGSRQLLEGDIVKIDVGILTAAGWIGDNAKSVAVGLMPEAAEPLLSATEASLYAAIACAREGEHLSSVCGAVESHVGARGFTVVKQFVGHGVGRKLHEDPQVPNYWDPREMSSRQFKNPRLQAGMVLAIEPMVNAGTEDVLILEDGWTVITADRALSAHFEHMVLITDGEPEILTPRPRSFVPSAD